MKVLVAMDEPHGARLAEGLEAEGVTVLAVVAASAPALASTDRLHGADTATLLQTLADADVLVLDAHRESATSALVAACDSAGVRIVPLGSTTDAAHLAALFGLGEVHPLDIDPWRLAGDLVRHSGSAVSPDQEPRQEPRTIVVWGPAGAPGRTTVSIELAVELARGGRRVALVDADTHAPSVAIALGLVDEGPGFAAACRQSVHGGLDPRELTRIGTPLGRTGVDVLTGINRPSRWPELSASRVTDALGVCRDWTDYTVVDVAASLERDEEIVSDLDTGPRRNAATLAALESADLVVAVAKADPVGVARFLRAHSELRTAIGATPVAVLANGLRPGALGIDARGQVRRALERFGSIRDVWFLPQDPRSADAALLAARPIAQIAPKSPLTLAIRRFVGEAVVPVPERVRPSARRRAA